MKRINQLKELRSEIGQLTAQMGQLYINKIKLEEAELKLKKELVTIEKKETDIAKTLSDKYDLSVSSSNEKTSLKESEELSSSQKKTLNRIKRGEKFEI